MSIFRKVTNEDGEETYEEVDLAQVELPDEVVHNHPAYRKVAESDVKRRKRIKELTAQLQSSAGADEPEEQQAEEQVTEPAPAPVTIDTEALFNEFMGRLTKQQQEEAEKAKADAERLNKLAKDNGLGEEAVSILRTSNDPEATAKLLAKSQFRFDDAEGGGLPGESGGDATLANILNKLGLAENS